MSLVVGRPRLDAVYRQNRGLLREGSDLVLRGEQVDFLGCHPDVQTEAWAAWQELMAKGGDMDEDEAGGWLDVAFVEPCPEHR